MKDLVILQSIGVHKNLKFLRFCEVKNGCNLLELLYK